MAHYLTEEERDREWTTPFAFERVANVSLPSDSEMTESMDEVGSDDGDSESGQDSSHD